MKHVVYIVGGVLLLFCLLVLLFLAFCTVGDYKPKSYEKISKGNSRQVVPDTFSVFTWNTGYAGLNREMDFFYDGGVQVRPTKEKVEDNLSKITTLIGTINADFNFLQEVDLCAKRSYQIDEYQHYRNAFPNLYASFATNYKVKYVPLPIREPMGGVEAGLVTLGKYEAVETTRHAYPFNFSWPLRVFMLDRCFLETRYPSKNGKELVLINTHNSAFDKNGKLRIPELCMLRDYMVGEYEKGNYVIAGGDFNQCPVGLESKFEGELFDFDEFIMIPDTLFPSDWNFEYDNSVPTNRRANIPYERGKTKVTLLDFFITSPNVSCVECEGIDLSFQNSDHNPVFARFSLR